MASMECRVCGNNKNNTPYIVKEMRDGLNESFEYFECSQCGCLQISTLPSDLLKYYSNNYYSFTRENKSLLLQKLLIKPLRIIRDKNVASSRGFISNILDKILPSPYMYMLMRAGANTETKIIDIGCGSGYLLGRLWDAGFYYLTGIDPYIEADTINNNVKIYKKWITELKPTDLKFDLIMFNHSFEHISNPNEALSAVENLLSENGVCIIRIPTVSSYAWKKYGVNWFGIDPPRHLYIHSLNSIKIFASKYNLLLTDYYYDSTEFQFWASEQNILSIPLTANNSYEINPKNSIFNKSKITTFKKESVKLNKQKIGDQVVLYFKKLNN